MKAKEAQERTEKRWLLLIRGEDTTACGWCLFAHRARPGRLGSLTCNHCPIKAVFGKRCGNLQAYNDWQYSDRDSDRMEFARIIYDLLVANRDALIQAGEEALREQTQQTVCD